MKIPDSRSSAATSSLANVQVCLIFEHSLSHYSRLLQEIEALQEAGAEVRLLTSHQVETDTPQGVSRTWAPLEAHVGLGSSAIAWRPLRILDNLCRMFVRLVVRGWRQPRARMARIAALKTVATQVHIFWVIDYPSLPTATVATRGTRVKLVYETVDLVPEYRYRGEHHRRKCLLNERRLLGEIDGFITASDSYADYYMERYWGSPLKRRPIVRDNMPQCIAAFVRPVRTPLRFLFLGSLMFDRPVNELITAMSITQSNVTLTFQGKNYLGDTPRDLIERLGLADKIRIVDPCSPDAIVDIAAGYDVGLVALAGRDENERRASTSKLFTYMAAGLVILGSDLPGIARVVNKHRNGLLVNDMEPQTWADAIDEIAALPETTMHEMKQRSLDAARQYSWERQKPLFIAEFARVLGRESAPRK